MKTPPFNLRTRILLLLFLGVALFGSTNLWLFDRLMLHQARRAIRDQGLALSRLFAEECVPLAVREDQTGLRTLAAELRRQYSDVLYVVIYTPEGRVFTSTFDHEPPSFLSAPRRETKSQAYRSDGQHFHDFEAPVADSYLGWVRLGLTEERVRRGLGAGKVAIGGMILLFLVVGAAGAWLIASSVHKGARQLVAGMQGFSFDTPLLPLPVTRTDEIGQVARSLEETLRRAQVLHQDHLALLNKFKEADRLSSMGLLASGLAHDINNPLGGLIASLQRLAKNPKDTVRVEAYLGPMLEAAMHIREVLSNLLRFLRRQRTEPGPVCLSEMAEKLRVLSGHRLSPNTRLMVNIPSSLPPVYFDPSCLLQVLINLVFNAADALEGRGGTIAVSAWASGEEVRVEVSDDGPGMAPEILSRVFDPFFSTKPPERGTGLGLPMSRQMVKDHGGTFTLESTPGQGTRAILLLRRVGP